MILIPCHSSITFHNQHIALHYLSTDLIQRSRLCIKRKAWNKFFEIRLTSVQISSRFFGREEIVDFWSSIHCISTIAILSQKPVERPSNFSIKYAFSGFRVKKVFLCFKKFLSVKIYTFPLKSSENVISRQQEFSINKMSEFFLITVEVMKPQTKNKTTGSNKQEKITFKKLTNCQ